jgi:hypothetical protein
MAGVGKMGLAHYGTRGAGTVDHQAPTARCASRHPGDIVPLAVAENCLRRPIGQVRRPSGMRGPFRRPGRHFRLRSNVGALQHYGIRVAISRNQLMGTEVHQFVAGGPEGRRRRTFNSTHHGSAGMPTRITSPLRSVLSLSTSRSDSTSSSGFPACLRRACRCTACARSACP